MSQGEFSAAGVYVGQSGAGKAWALASGRWSVALGPGEVSTSLVFSWRFTGMVLPADATLLRTVATARWNTGGVGSAVVNVATCSAPISSSSDTPIYEYGNVAIVQPDGGDLILYGPNARVYAAHQSGPAGTLSIADSPVMRIEVGNPLPGLHNLGINF